MNKFSVIVIIRDYGTLLSLNMAKNHFTVSGLLTAITNDNINFFFTDLNQKPQSYEFSLYILL